MADIRRFRPLLLCFLAGACGKGETTKGLKELLLQPGTWVTS